MHFADKQQHAIPFFLDSNFLHIQMIYFEKIASLMHDASYRIAPVLIRKLFTKTEDVHSYSSRSAYSGNFYVKFSRLETQKFSFSRSGSCIYNCLPVGLRNESKKKFKQQLRTLLKQMLENEDDYIGVDKIISRMPYFEVFINTKTQ